MFINALIRIPPSPARKLILVPVFLACALILVSSLPVFAASSAAGEEDSSSKAATEKDQADQTDSEEATVESQITIYTTTWCGYCRRTRALLDELEVVYLDKDVESSEEAAREFREIAGPRAGVPLVIIGDTVLRGFSEPKIRSAITALQSDQGE